MDGEKEEPTIRLKVQHQGKEALHYKIKRNKRLFKLLTVYCERSNIDYKTMRFVYDGRRVLPTHTPNSLHMRDGDVIDVMGESDGGGGTNL